MPKPHLVSYRERIAIDGEPISRERLRRRGLPRPARHRPGRRAARPADRVRGAHRRGHRRAGSAASRPGDRRGRPWRPPRRDERARPRGCRHHQRAAATTRRSWGRPLTAIGREKAAIVKPGNLAVTGAAGRGLRPILDRCAALDVPLLRAGTRQRYRARVTDAGWDGITVDATTPRGRLPGLRIGLLGAHQARKRGGGPGRARRARTSATGSGSTRPTCGPAC